MNFKQLFFFITLGLLCCSCSKDENQTIQPSDYSNTNNWASLPSNPSKPVDIFYIYPSSWFTDDLSILINTIDHPMMREGALQNIAEDASAFETVGNIYAPFYRQYNCMYLITIPAIEQYTLFAREGLADVTAAFEYYFEHYNNGRPFILAGHSQGSGVMLQFLSNYMKKHPEVQERMIAAYPIGYSPWSDYMQANPHLKFAERADDTGVIAAYHTEASTFNGENVLLIPGCISINPLTWTRDETHASIALNLGSKAVVNGVLTDVPGIADAQIDLERGTVRCSTADPNIYTGAPLFPNGIFHFFDYQFFYYNIRQNAQDRTDAYLNR